MLGALVGVLASPYGYPTIGGALGQTAISFGAGAQSMSYSRAAETNADHAGAYTCAQAGYNPWGMVWLFEKYATRQAAGQASGQKMEALSDHPKDDHRIADLETTFNADPKTFGQFKNDIATATPLEHPSDCYAQQPQGYPQQGYPQQPQGYPQQAAARLSATGRRKAIRSSRRKATRSSLSTAAVRGAGRSERHPVVTPGMKFSISLAIRLAAVASVALFVVHSGGLGAAAQQLTSGIDLTSLDRTCKPCDDFYQFANGGWIKNHPIPAAYPQFGTSNILVDKNRQVTHEILEAAAKSNAAAGTDEQKIGDYYASCMDTAAIQKAGTAPLDPLLAQIGGIVDAKGVGTGGCRAADRRRGRVLRIRLGCRRQGQHRPTSLSSIKAASDCPTATTIRTPTTRASRCGPRTSRT